jgi:drug/metabolite transporter (DMT)-like permease
VLHATLAARCYRLLQRFGRYDTTRGMRRNLPDLWTFPGLGAILLWSATFAFARSLSEKVGSLTAAAAVFLIAGLFCGVRLTLAGASLERFRQLSRRYLLGCGGLFIFYTTAIYLAVGLARNREQLLEIALVNYLWPALTVLLSLALLKKRGNLWLFPGTAIALAGVFLTITQGAHISWASLVEHLRTNPAAYALALAAAISWAFYSNLTRRWARPDSDGAVDLFVPATALVLVVLRCLVPETTVWNVRAMAETAGLGLVTGLAYVFWEMSMRKGNVLVVMACSYFTPLLSTLVSCAYLGVAPTNKLWLGCALIVGGSVITWRSVSDAET